MSVAISAPLLHYNTTVFRDNRRRDTGPHLEPTGGGGGGGGGDGVGGGQRNLLCISYVYAERNSP